MTSWADAGITPDLTTGRWVILGEPTKANYFKTGLVGPKYSEGHFFMPKTSFDNYITATVPKNSVQWPSGIEYYKGFFGQRVLK